MAYVYSKAVVLLLICCLLLLPLWESVIVLCFVECYFMPLLVLQLSWWGRESWLLCLVCLSGVLWLLCGFSSWCHGFVCTLWLWYFLIILAYYFFVFLSLSKCCVADFGTLCWPLTQKLLKQGYRYHKLGKTFLLNFTRHTMVLI